MPSQFSIFKGKSAMRMQLQKPEAIEDKFKIGCIILQMAPFKEEKNGVRIFAWEEQKVTVKLGIMILLSLFMQLILAVKLNCSINLMKPQSLLNSSSMGTRDGSYLLLKAARMALSKISAFQFQEKKVIQLALC